MFLPRGLSLGPGLNLLRYLGTYLPFLVVKGLSILLYPGLWGFHKWQVYNHRHWTPQQQQKFLRQKFYPKILDLVQGANLAWKIPMNNQELTEVIMTFPEISEFFSPVLSELYFALVPGIAFHDDEFGNYEILSKREALLLIIWYKIQEEIIGLSINQTFLPRIQNYQYEQWVLSKKLEKTS